MFVAAFFIFYCDKFFFYFIVCQKKTKKQERKCWKEIKNVKKNEPKETSNKVRLEKEKTFKVFIFLFINFFGETREKLI